MSKRFFKPSSEMENYVFVKVKMHNDRFTEVCIAKDKLDYNEATGQYSAEHDVLRDHINDECFKANNILPLFVCGLKVNFN